MLLRISSEDEVAADSDVLLPISTDSSSLSGLRFDESVSVFYVLILLELLLLTTFLPYDLAEPLLAFERLLICRRIGPIEDYFYSKLIYNRVSIFLFMIKKILLR